MFIITLLLLFISPQLSAQPPPIQLATKFHENINIEHYWVSEKLDGVRGYWDGEHLISRSGNILTAPSWFTADFPKTKMDGELWISRGQFEAVSGIVRRDKGDKSDWKQISFMIFDLPDSKDTFSHRVQLMQELVANSKSPFLKMIKQQKFSTQQALQEELDRIINEGGEGLMLHHNDAHYQAKRSQDLMKLKRYEDAEAIVLKHLPGKGKHSGRLGALVVETDSGIVFKIGTGFTDKERENPPQIGEVITFKFMGKTKNGVPRFASYLRIRKAL